MMKANVGGIDRVLRIVIGVAVISLVFIGPQTQWGWLGLVPLLSGLLAFCPLYAVIGMSTCKKS